MSDELIAAHGPAAAHARDARRDARDPRRRTGPTTSTRTRASAAGGRAGTPTCARSSACRSSPPEGVIGAFYLTDKEGAAAFGDADQEVIELLAAHAAIAITNARLLRAQPRAVDRSPSATGSRSSSTTSSARSSSALVLTAEAAGDAARPRPGGGARAASRACADARRARRSRSCARSSSSCARPTSTRDGLAARCASTSSVLRRAARRGRSTLDVDAGERRRRRRRATARCCGSPRRRCTTRCATRRRGASPCGCAAPTGGSCSRSPTTAPASTPPTPSCASRHLGLTSMEERARAARRRAARSTRRPGRARPCGWRSPRG